MLYQIQTSINFSLSETKLEMGLKMLILIAFVKYHALVYYQYLNFIALMKIHLSPLFQELDVIQARATFMLSHVCSGARTLRGRGYVGGRVSQSSAL